jgi:hypothetical protein
VLPRGQGGWKGLGGGLCRRPGGAQAVLLHGFGWLAAKACYARRAHVAAASSVAGGARAGSGAVRKRAGASASSARMAASTHGASTRMVE